MSLNMYKKPKKKVTPLMSFVFHSAYCSFSPFELKLMVLGKMRKQLYDSYSSIMADLSL